MSVKNKNAPLLLQATELKNKKTDSWRHKSGSRILRIPDKCSKKNQKPVEKHSFLYCQTNLFVPESTFFVMKITVIQKRIYEIRGYKVMLDFDLAELYGLENKYLKRAVRQNIIRFPVDFMFELTPKEWEDLRCSFSTSNKRGGTR